MNIRLTAAASGTVRPLTAVCSAVHPAAGFFLGETDGAGYDLQQSIEYKYLMTVFYTKVTSSREHIKT